MLTRPSSGLPCINLLRQAMVRPDDDVCDPDSQWAIAIDDDDDDDDDQD